MTVPTLCHTAHLWLPHKVHGDLGLLLSGYISELLQNFTHTRVKKWVYFKNLIPTGQGQLSLP